jgi:general stress protein CsbA
MMLSGKSMASRSPVSIFDITLSNVAKLAFLAVCLTAPFAPSGAFQALVPGLPTSVLMLAFGALSLSLFILLRGSVKANGGQRLVAALLFLPFALSLMVGAPYAAWSSPLGLVYDSYFSLAFGRILNISLLFMVFLGALTLFNQHSPLWRRKSFLMNVVAAYWIGALILMIFGMWQAISLYSGWLPFPFGGLRTHVHSVPAPLRGLVPGRVTSITNEPSFFAPLVLDFLLLAPLILRGRKLLAALLLGITLLLLTFSGGGYLNAFLVLLAIATLVVLRVLTKGAIRATSAVLGGLLLMVVLIMLVGPLSGYASIVTSRLDSAFDLDKHARAYMVFMPFSWAWDSTFINMLFGHGPKSYGLLGQVFVLPSTGAPVHVTSNNLFADNFWEHGVFGFVASLLVFAYLLARSALAKNEMTLEHWVAYALTVHLAASSLYRADFASARFAVLLLVVVMLLTVTKARHERRSRVPEVGNADKQS